MAQPQATAISAMDRAPDEVWLEIFLLVAAVDPGHDENSFPTYGPHPLLPVVQVNKRFNTIASPLLVRDWHLRPADESGAKFVLHLLKHPQLHSQVKSLAVDERALRVQQGHDVLAPRRTNDGWPQSFCSPTELEQLARSAEETFTTLGSWVHEHEGSSWSGQIRQRSPHAIVALAVAWATGLQELDLMMDDWTLGEVPGRWICRLVQMAVGVLTPPGVEARGLPLPDMFTKLQCVSLSKYSLGADMPAFDAAAFLRLPSLRVLKGRALKVFGLTLDEPDTSGSSTSLQPSKEYLFPNGSSSVEELHLYRCLITDNGLSVLTRSCRRLRVLALRWKWSDHVTSRGFPNDSIASAIRRHSASLEKVLIGGSDQLLDDDDDDAYALHPLDEFDPGSLGGCLLFCDKLETLLINLERLYGREYNDQNSSCQPLTEVLPPGLTRLGLSLSPLLAGGQVIKDRILGLLHQCGPDGRFFKLQKIGLIGSRDGFMADEEMTALAKRNGVELTKHDRPDGMM